METRKKEEEIYRNYKNNAIGRSFERGIEVACKRYEEEGRAAIQKVPEPFRVTKKKRAGIFEGRFTAKASPDFIGTLDSGRSIIFEAKYTSTEVIKQKVITNKQWEILERYYKLGALAAVCVGIQDRYFFVPWDIWRDMKNVIGKKSARAEDLEAWEVRWKHGIDFLASYGI